MNAMERVGGEERVGSNNNVELKGGRVDNDVPCTMVTTDSEPGRSDCPGSSAPPPHRNLLVDINNKPPPDESPAAKISVEELTYRAAVQGSSHNHNHNHNHMESSRAAGKFEHLYRLGSSAAFRGGGDGGDVDSQPRDMDQMLSRIRQQLAGAPSERLNLKPFVNKRSDQNLEAFSERLRAAGGENGVMNGPGWINDGVQSKTPLSSSSFSQLILKRAMKGKGVVGKHQEAPPPPPPPPPPEFVCDQDGVCKDKKLDNSSSKSPLVAHDPSLALKPIPRGHNGIVSHGEGNHTNSSSSCGISLREFIRSSYGKREKRHSLSLFRQLVELIGSAHSQGLFLLELRPSLFALVPSKKLRYNGTFGKSSIESDVDEDFNRKRHVIQESSTGGRGLKKRRMDLNAPGNQLQATSSGRPLKRKSPLIDLNVVDVRNPDSCELQQQNYIKNLGVPSVTRKQSMSTWLEEQWYTCPEEINGEDIGEKSNIYALGVLLFELLCHCESSEMHAAMMADLRHRILPPAFLSRYPKEAGFCLWLLHPEPSSRPTAREILKSELICEEDSVKSTAADEEISELLLHFLSSLEKQKKKNASKLLNLPHPWRMWKLNNVHEILKRDYQLRPVAIEIFSMDGCNDLLVFHKKEREEVFKNLVAMNLSRNSMLDTTISGSAKQESNEGSRLFRLMAKSFSKRWQNGEISNFHYLMHLNTLAGRGYSDLTQYPVFPWVLADYDSESLDLSDPKTFRKLHKPMGCQTPEGEEEFRKRYESWDDPEIPKFHYGSHYSSAGIVLFYLLRLPPFSAENQKLQGGQFDHADRLFNSIKDTWLSAAGKGNTSDVKELIPEFFYMPEFLENRFSLDLGEKQSGEKVGDVFLPPWARGSVREFILKHREALESDYVSENLHHWIDLIFGYKQRGKAAEEAVNVFYHYTYEGNVDIDAVSDPALKASILAQINHFGQTPKQLFQKAHVKRRTDRKIPLHPLKHSMHLIPHETRKCSSSISQITTFHDKVLVAGANCFLKPRGYTKYITWGFPDRSLRFMSYDQDKLLSTHENLHESNQIQCAGFSHDGRIVVTGAEDGLVCVWRISKDGPRGSRRLQLEKALCAHTATVTCLRVSQPYQMIASGSDDCTVIIWDLSSMSFVRQLPDFPVPISAIYINDLTGEIVTAAGTVLAVWSINGDCLAVANTSQLPSDSVLSVTGSTSSDWLETAWYVTGHQSGAIKIWRMIHCTDPLSAESKTSSSNRTGGLNLGDQVPEYKLILHKVLKFHKQPVTALYLPTDLKQLLSGDSAGQLLSWTLPDETLRASLKQASLKQASLKQAS